MSNPLKDVEFLTELDKQKSRETYARITALTWDENPIEYIEGKITGGSINLDGTSAIRRTCSLNLVAYDINLDNFYYGLNSKINIEIGIKNIINTDYPDIIWFPQGIYVLTSFNSSVSLNAYNISLSAKDKMCLLNGDISGILNSPIDFGVEEYYDKETETTTYTHIPVKDIILNAVHVYGGEPLHNIIISDLDDYGYELLEYRGDEDSYMYLIRSKDTDFYTNMTMRGDQPCQFFQDKIKDENGVWQEIEKKEWKDTKFADLEADGGLYDKRIDDIIVLQGSTIRLTEDGDHYSLHRIASGETVGYRLTELTYAGDLIAKVGETLTSILDKIKNMLGNFEYFYDIDGRFIFQKKKNNLYNNWNPLQKTEEGTWVNPNEEPLSYTFYDSFLFTQISQNPALNNLKNDFSIWGERESISGTKVSVHFRYALDRKPTKYVSIEVTEEEAAAAAEKYGIIVKHQKSDEYIASDTLDWRELIYQMALDYYAYNRLDDFLLKIAEKNPEDYPTGYTGYEQYYIDMQGFWRQLYDPDPEEDEKENYDSVTHWHLNVKDNPAMLNFWFDFLGEGTVMDKYLVPTIGTRAKAVNDKDVSAIYFKETPDVLFLTNEEYTKMGIEAFQTGYTYIRINNTLDNFFKISSQGKSAHDVLEQLLYENTVCTETITITSLPIYYLQPNIRIGIKDSISNIDGEYIISRISLPLTYNGTMSITATKAADTIY